jgi:hypothetical protein
MPQPQRSIEDLRKEFIQKWDSGQFEWNHHEGDKLGEKPNSLWRVWNEFIEPALTAERERSAAMVREAKEEVFREVLAIAYGVDMRGRTWVDTNDIRATAEKHGFTIND